MITRDGWLKTGDLVTENPDREFFVVGRLKELIKVNGRSFLDLVFPAL